MTFHVVILGSNSAIPTANRNPTSQLLNHNERYFLIDCGEGTQIQLRRNKIKIQRINQIFISHMHGDHYFGLIGLVTTMHLLGREKPLSVYGPEKLRDVIEVQLNASGTKLNYQLDFHPLNQRKSEVIYEDDLLLVKTIPLKHGIACSGFLFTEKQKLRKILQQKIEAYCIPLSAIRGIAEGKDFTDENGQLIPNDLLTEDPAPTRSYAFCSDTGYHEPLIELVKDVNLLYHEATFLASDQGDRAKETYHSTAQDAARIALKAGVRQLLIGHYSARYKDVTPLLNEAVVTFKNTVLAKEGERYEII